MLLERSLERAAVHDFQERLGHIKNRVSVVVQTRRLEERRVVGTGNCSKKAGTVVRWNGDVYCHGETDSKFIN